MKSVVIRTVTMLSLIVLASAPALAATQYVLEIKGLSCPFCAYGLEKKLKKVEHVKSVELSPSKGQAMVMAKEGTTIDEDKLREAVKEAGFSIASLKKVESKETRTGGDGQ